MILTVARLHSKKALLDGLLALAELRRRGVEFRYRLAGEGDDRAALEAAVADLGLSDRVEFIGTLERAAVRDAMRRSDVFLLPSVREEFGVVLGESQCCGRPVVATRVGGIPEVVEAVSADCWPPRDPPDLADKLAFLLALPDGGRAIGLRGRERIVRLFDRRRLELELIECYRALLEGRRALRIDGATAAATSSGHRLRQTAEPENRPLHLMKMIAVLNVIGPRHNGHMTSGSARAPKVAEGGLELLGQYRVDDSC